MLHYLEALLLLFLVAVAVVFGVTPAAAEDLPAIEPNSEGVFFSIGKEDGYRYGYRFSGWSEIDDYACIVGVDCNSQPFPSHLHTPSSKSEWADTAVERVNISFRLSQSYDNVVLRLVRAGAETIVVQLDDSDTTRITKSMMVPRTYEHSDFGAHDLLLGHLDAGVHLLQLSVEEDGEGNGRFGWDAINLSVASQ